MVVHIVAQVPVVVHIDRSDLRTETAILLDTMQTRAQKLMLYSIAGIPMNNWESGLVLEYVTMALTYTKELQSEAALSGRQAHHTATARGLTTEPDTQVADALP